MMGYTFSLDSGSVAYFDGKAAGEPCPAQRLDAVLPFASLGRLGTCLERHSDRHLRRDLSAVTADLAAITAMTLGMSDTPERARTKNAIGPSD